MDKSQLFLMHRNNLLHYKSIGTDKKGKQMYNLATLLPNQLIKNKIGQC